MNANQIYAALIANLLPTPGIETIKLPWDEHQEVNVIDPIKYICDDPLAIAKVVGQVFVLGYFMHYDRDDNRRWYGHIDWRLLDEYAITLAEIKAQEG